MIIGTSVGLPQPANTSTELDSLRQDNLPAGEGTTRERAIRVIESEYRSAAGIPTSDARPVIGAFHTYQDYILTDTDVHQMGGQNAWREGRHHVCNLRLKYWDGTTSTEAVPDFAAGKAQALGALADYVGILRRQMPPWQRWYIPIEHEPEVEKEAGRYSYAAMRRAFAFAARTIVRERGDAQIIPVFTPMAWSWKWGGRNSGRVPETDLRLIDDLEYVGLDPSEVVIGPDGYAADPRTDSPAGIFTDPLSQYQSEGFSRFAWSEVACKSHDENAEVAAAKRAATAGWMRDMFAEAKRWNMEYLCWFASGIGGNAGMPGWYIYGNRNKAEFARLSRSALAL